MDLGESRNRSYTPSILPKEGLNITIPVEIDEFDIVQNATPAPNNAVDKDEGVCV